LMSSVDFGPIAAQQAREQWSELGQLMISEARRLEGAGADALLICTNTMHIVADQVQTEINIPLLHIADAAGRQLKRLNVSRAGLLGTIFTMDKGFYKKRLQTKFAVDILVPDAAQKKEVHRIIYEELCQGVINENAKAVYVQTVNAMVARGCNAIILGCTEIGLLLQQQDASIPLLDTASLHCEMAVDFMLS
jgi:aspartate racemase